MKFVKMRRSRKCLVTVVAILVLANISLIGYYLQHVNISNVYTQRINNMLPDSADHRKFSECILNAQAHQRKSNVSMSGESEIPLFKALLLPHELPEQEWPPSQQLISSQLVPRFKVVHQILWTDTMYFRNYLSLLSVWKIFQPYLIILYTRTTFKPRTPQFAYNDWYEKAASRIPALQIQKASILDKQDYSPSNEAVHAVSFLKRTGGIFVNMNTTISSNIWLHQNKTLEAVIDVSRPLGFIALIETSEKKKRFWTGYAGKSQSSCVQSAIFTGSELCCTVWKNIFPVNIMWTSSSFGSLARTLMYGTSVIPYPSVAFPAIPRIVHYVWFGDQDMSYSMYMSFLSTQKFVKPIKIFIYTNTRTRSSSFYFDKMSAHSNVDIVYYGPRMFVYQNRIADDIHASDIVRADVLLRVGGIYIDWDVYWMKHIDPLLSKGYETIAALDFYDEVYPRKSFPDTINMGVVLARPGSRFIAKWQESFNQYIGTHPTYHAVEMVYKIYEEHPDLLVLENRLQVMCYLGNCHPLWLDDYKNFSAHHSFDFKQDVYTIHFTDPRPEEFKSKEAMDRSTGVYGDMARHILQ